MEDILYITRPFRPIYRLLGVKHVNMHVMDAQVIVFSPKEQHFEMLWVPAHDIRSRVRRDLFHFLKHPHDYLPSVEEFRRWLHDVSAPATRTGPGTVDPGRSRTPSGLKPHWHKRMWSFARSAFPLHRSRS